MGAAWLIGACSNIIGLSDYDVIPSPSGGSMNEGGEPHTSGGKKGGGGSDQGGSARAGSDTGGTDAGADSGGSSNGGSNTAGSNSGGTDTAGGEGGSSTGGTNTAGSNTGGSGGNGGCKSSLDCNDSIACTKDACGANGVCTHTPDDTKCDSTRCEVCSVGIGCVAGPTEETQLLTDPAFDLGSADWDQTSDRFGKNIFADAAAQTPGNIAKFGPAAANASAQEYGDLLQFVTIPANVVGITLKGYYKLTPGTGTGMKVPKNDYVAIGFWDPASSDIMPVEQFDAIHGDSGAQASWKAFSYSMSAIEVQTLAGNEYTFDLVANTWGSIFQFDTLELNATTCK
jgi:hypothetical protein